MVVFGTILAAIAQVLIKRGALGLESKHVIDMITNVNLIAGYALYGIFTILLSLALRHGTLHPVSDHFVDLRLGGFAVGVFLPRTVDARQADRHCDYLLRRGAAGGEE